MKQLSSAEFRKQYASLAEPVEVTNHGIVMATFIPAGHPFTWGAGDDSGPTQADPDPAPVETRMSIRPVKGTPKPMVAAEQRIIDPVQKAQREREIWSQLQAKMNPSKGSTRR